MKKAIALLSGGLDSMLAIKLMQEQGVDVLAVNFTSPMCTCGSKADGCGAATKAARELGVPVKLIPKGMDYFRMVEDPKHGRGSAMNPCIDCRIYIFRRAKEMMAEEGADFLVSGEVMGQRPMSQRKETMRCIEREAGVDGLVLRPLSAKFLEPTIAENEGWVNRELLLDISGRGRKRQFELADDLGIKDYPCPAGGCLLTEKSFASRIADLFEYEKASYGMEDVRLLKYGRHFRLAPDLKVIVSRNENEEQSLRSFIRNDCDLFLSCGTQKGAAVLVRNASKPIDNRIYRLAYRYSDVAPGEELELVHEGIAVGTVTVNYDEKNDFAPL